MSVLLPALFLAFFVAVYLWALANCLEPVVIPQPQFFVAQQIGRDLMADTLVYEISVGAPAGGDVVARRLTVTVNGLPQEVKEFPAETVSFGALSVPQDSEVQLALSDRDDAGNYSEPATIDFVALDTIAPPQPGAFTITLVGELHADRTVTTTTDEVVVPEPEAPVVPEPEAPAEEV